MWDAWYDDDAELDARDEDELGADELDELDADLARALRTGADEAIQPNHQTAFEILRRMAARQGAPVRRARVLAQEQGIQIGPQQLGHPDNRRRGFERADGAYRSRTGRYGISLEVERSRGAADAELRKHLSAMRTALNRQASPDAVRGGSAAAQRRIRPRDIQSSARSCHSRWRRRRL